ncbi:Nucleoside-diphosphate-sugar epimerase [Micromonospora phaseoli]|uniref:Nucleoside-diphosphate-sugar epimerase n=1 Tax=Micromonospora phaseoli TaxID=1144548 RepID=A0A1H7BC77_9ACTN|nr:NAD(P)H-binding protein [Micromonospora phaseoli]PZV95045.1 nucleoside-diphosphate-sugar epimerase [Micromonospora phaseoli]GIJ79530.1 NmrA family transcriptional regulator [Micromonospora phaseoli]SEJ75289.1 Nucleoside-diphosphate-sugar epimerase [Micromonospora phaseoli]
MRVLVTGAGGTLGGAVLPRLVAEGFEVRATSRRARTGSGVRWVVADLATGAGVDEAVSGVDAVLHLASSPTRRTHQVDVLGTRRLVGAAATAGVQHLVYVSIVGVDRVPYSYYRHKLAAEQVVAAGEVPWTVLRATQFPQFLDELLRMSSKLGPVIGDRAVLAQPVDPGEVAGELIELLRSGAQGGIVEFGGPEVLRFDDAVRTWRQARRSRRPLLPIRFPGRLGRELRSGGLVTEARPTGRRTWVDYLTDTYGRTVAR